MDGHERNQRMDLMECRLPVLNRLTSPEIPLLRNTSFREHKKKSDVEDPGPLQLNSSEHLESSRVPISPCRKI
ncbi:hypothetical protein CEXT_405691 [Caerostris extrusa]|uniref:Uncharacterized protein n=1 Tax=Caerostris extrusa TaxID=172846 RepID=A0AAV4UNI2_CAEEX|nr:hypothetical protein CEXT_405691 [Caerostris extrusa]